MNTSRMGDKTDVSDFDLVLSRLAKMGLYYVNLKLNEKRTKQNFFSDFAGSAKQQSCTLSM
jgi:hypothetical protein